MKITLLFGLLSFWSSLLGYEVKIRVVDDQGVAVSGVSAKIAFVKFRNEADAEHVGVTDKDGIFTANGRGEHSVFVEASKHGYYLARLRRLPNDKDLDLVVVIPRVLNPAPLYANRVNPSIPVQNEWLGYDFEAADWVAPHGKGKVIDIRFRFRNEFKGWKHGEKELEHSRKVNSQLTEKEFKDFYGKWDGELDISFPGEKEGLFEETRFLEYSELKLPHSAPVEGYVPTWHCTSNSYSPRTAREKMGFFLRTRVKLDEKGNVLSANYAKLMGDIYCAPTGVLMFTYYFNPRTNDRNLEFNPRNNLFPSSFPGANVNDP